MITTKMMSRYAVIPSGLAAAVGAAVFQQKSRRLASIAT